MNKNTTPLTNNESNLKRPFFLRIPKVVYKLVRVLITLVIFWLALRYLIPQISSLKETWDGLKSMRYWAVVVAFLGQVVFYSGSGLVLKKIMRLTNHHISILRGALIALAGYSIGLVAGGMFGTAALTFRWMKNSGGRTDGATLAAFLPPVLLDIALIGVSFFGLIYLLLIHNLSQFQAIAFIIILFIILCLVVLMILAAHNRDVAIELVTNSLQKMYLRLQIPFPHVKYEKTLHSIFTAYDVLISGKWKGLFFGTGLIILGDLITIFFLFIAVNNMVTPGVLLAGYGLPLLFSKMAFFIPGGIGLIEATMTALYVSLGVPEPIAVVVILGYRFFTFWIPVIVGFILFPFLQNSVKKES